MQVFTVARVKQILLLIVATLKYLSIQKYVDKNATETIKITKKINNKIIKIKLL